MYVPSGQSFGKEVPAMQKVPDGQTFPVTPSVGALVLAALEQ